MAKTTYVILANTDDGGPRWQVVGSSEGSSRKAALRAFIAKDAPVLTEDTGGTYVAVPARSWSPTPVEAEVQTRIKIG